MGGEVKAVSVLGLVLVSHLLQQLIQIIYNSFATLSTTKRMIEEIWGSKATSKKPLKSMSHKTTSGKTPCNFTILAKFSKQKVSYFESFQSRPKGI